MTTRPMAEPSTSATDALPWRSPLRSAECRRIQTIIQVIIPTATSAITVSSCSCSRWGRFSSATCSPHAAPPQSSTAMTTPSHIHRSESRRPCCDRNAAMIPTISAASRPSRRPMTKVGSTA